MPFHRYKQPVYAGAPALPAGPATVSFNGISYNLFNVVSEGNGSGGAAFVDGAKADGSNVGTYFVAFSEDATSSAANRGLKALAENTDYLDDVLNKDLATPVSTNVATAGGGGVSSIALPTSTFVGNSGGYPLAGLFSILDQNDNDILVGGVKVAASSITGAVVGDGFSAGVVTVTLTVSIPNGQQYRVYYATRGSLAAMPVDALTSINVRSVEGVEAELQNIVNSIKGENAAGLSNPWDTSSVYNLAGLGFNGFNGLYRRATAFAPYSTDPTVAPTDINKAGSGAEILVDGRSFTLRAPSVPTGSTDGRYMDTFQSLLTIDDRTTQDEAFGTNRQVQGRFGLTAIRNPISSVGGIATFLNHQSTFATKITPSSTAQLALVGGGNYVWTLTLGAGDFFVNGTSGDVAWMHDVIWVRLPASLGAVPVTGSRDVALRLLGPVTGQPTQAYVSLLDGATNNAMVTGAPSASPRSVTVLGWGSASFIQENWWARRANATFNAQAKAQLGGIAGIAGGKVATFVTPPFGGINADYQDDPVVQIFTRVDNAPEVALAWGQLNPIGSNHTRSGKLLGDGSITGTGITLSGLASLNGGGRALTLTVGDPATGYSQASDTITTGAGLASIGAYLEVGAGTDTVRRGIVRANRFSLLQHKGSRHLIITGGAFLGPILMWDSNITFTPASDRTGPSNLKGGSKFPQALYCFMTSSIANGTLQFNLRLPFRDVSVGDELYAQVMIHFTGIGSTAQALCVAQNHSVVVGGTTYQCTSLDGDNATPMGTLSSATAAGANGKLAIFTGHFRCAFVGTNRGNTAKSVIWECPSGLITVRSIAAGSTSIVYTQSGTALNNSGTASVSLSSNAQVIPLDTGW